MALNPDPLGVSDALDPSVDTTTSLVAPGAVPLEPMADDPPQGTPKPPLAPAKPRRRVPPPAQQGAAFVAAQRDPNRWKQVTALADQLGLQPDFVARNYDELAKADTDRRQVAQMSGVSPTFGSWLENPDNATLAKHEMDPLGRVDQAARLLTPDKDKGFFDYGFFSDVGTAEATGVAELGKSTGLLAASFGLMDPKRAAHFIADMAQRSVSLADQAPNYRKEYQTALEHHAGDVNKAWQTYLASSEGTEKGAIRKALDALATGGATLGEAMSLIGAAVTRPRGLGYGLVESLASMVPIVGTAVAGGAAGAAAGSVLPVLGTAAGGVIGSMAGTFAGAAPMNVGSEVAQELQKRGIDLTDATAVERALSDPNLMAMVRSKALAGGVTSAAVMSLFAGFSGAIANAPVRAAEKAMAAEIAKGTMTAAEAQAKLALARASAQAGQGVAEKVTRTTGDAAVQAVGVAAGTEAGAVAKGEPVDPARALQTTLEMMGFGFASEVTGESRRALFHKEPTVAAREAHVQTLAAMRSAHDAQALAEIGTAMKEAETVGGLPDRVRSLVETATGGRDAGTVFFQSAEWDKYWQAQGASPAKAAADIMADGGKAYHDAQATGALMAIPLADYVAKVAPTEHWDGLLPNARMRAEGMSLGEAQTYLQSLPSTMKDIATEAKAMPPEGADRAVQVGANVEQQLRATGVGEATAKAQAQVYESTFRALGERTGIDPLELYNRYALSISKGSDAGLADLSKGPLSLQKGEAIIEHTPLEGEPALLTSLKVGTEQKSDVRTLKNEELPAAILHLEKQMRAVEASDNPANVDAMRADLATLQAEVARRGMGGTEMKLPFRVVDSEGRTRGRFHTKEEAQAAIKNKGLTVAESTVPKVPTVDEVAQTLEQSGRAVTNTPEFGRWFGDSKVVDDRGEPLVVYHGTPDPSFKSFKYRGGFTGRLGYWFASKAEATERFQRERYAGVEPGVMKVYLSITNPKVYDGWASLVDAVNDHRLRKMNSKSGSAVVNAGGDSVEWGAESLRRQLMRDGFDGILLRNSTTDGGVLRDDWVAFDSKQIKSATGNRGTFDPKSANILEQPAYHGSPHVFDEFKLQHIGTGEGAAAYGWGLYFTNEKDIAKFYRDKLTPRGEFRNFRLGSKQVFRNGELLDYSPGPSDYENVRASLIEQLLMSEGDLQSAQGAGKLREYVLGELDAKIKELKQEWPEGVQPAQQLRRELERPGAIKMDMAGPSGRLYKVEIPEEQTMLDWDAPLKDQQPEIREAIRDILKTLKYLRPDDNGPRQLTSAWKAFVMENAGMLEGDKGSTAYGALVNAALRYDGNPVNELYRKLAKEAADAGTGQRDAQEAASRYLASLGITGIKYKAGQVANIDNSRATNYVVFDDKLVKVMEFEQNQGGGARGRITFGNDKTFNIELLAKADRSTFLHETGHFYLEVLGDLAGRPDAPADIVADHAIVRQWLGAEEGKPLTVAQHEQFARGFERYLMEGKAPSEKLRGAFYRFKTWLVGIYKNLTALNVELTPEVRGVFDRLLATKDEIAAEEARQQAQPLFTDPRALGMNEAQATKYEAAVTAAQQAAEEQLSTRMMRDVVREQSAEWKAWRDPILKEVTAEINARPEYQALAFLQKHTKADGTPLPEGTPELKLHRQAVIDTYGAELAARLPRGIMATPEKGGTNIAVVAEMFGYPNARALIDALDKIGNKQTLIEYMTDQRMQQQHGERPTQPEIQEAATEAVRAGAKRQELLRLELEHLAGEQLPKLKGMIRDITRAIPPAAETKVQADRIVGDTAVRDLRPDLFGAAADRHGRTAREALLRGDVTAAFDAKRQQILATAVYDAAVRAKESVADALVEFKPMFRSDERLADTRDMDLVNAARAVLASFGIGQTDKPPAAYLEQLRQYDPEMYETVHAMVLDATTHAMDYQTMTYADFADLRESVNAMWDLSRRTRQLEIDGKKVDRQVVEQELGDRLHAITSTGQRPGYDRAATTWDKTKMGLMGVRAALRRVESWVDAADDASPTGAFRRYLWNPISEGIAKYRLEKRGILEQYLKIVHSIEATLGQAEIPAPEIGYTFKNKGELLGALLHTGNKSNLEKLLLGRQWADVMEDGQMDAGRWQGLIRRLQQTGVLVKADYDYLQATWNLFEQLKPAAQKAHRDMYGRYFAEITHDAFTTPYGDYAGGYYPAKADPFLVPDAAIRREQEAVLGSGNSFMFPTTGRGFTKARVQNYHRPLIIDAAYVPSALDAVLRFTHIEPRVRDVARVVMSREFRPMLDAFDPTVGGDMLVPWLQRSAQQRIDTPTQGWGGKFFDTAFRELRTRTGLSIMSANVVNALQQLTGLTTSMIKVKPRHMAAALWRYVRAPKESAAWVAEKSDFMATRETAQVMEIQKSIDHLMLNPTKYEQLRDFTKEHGYFLSSGAQNIVDTTTWMAKYDEAVGRGVSEKEAVREADSAVRLTQGSFAPEDVSRFETGTPFQRAFTQFYSYFNAMANLQGSELATVARNLGLRKGAGRLLYVYTLGIMLPAVLSEALMRAASGTPIDQDDDGPVDDVLSMFFGSQARVLTAMVPGVGPALTYGLGKFTGQNYNDHITVSPAVSTLESVVRTPYDVYQAIKEKQLKTQHLRDVLTSLSLLTGVPVTPLAKPLGYLHDVQTGRAQPTGPIDFTRGLLTGRPGKP